MKPISTIKTPFPEKFGVPRQSGLVQEAIGILEFPKNDFYSEAFRGIEESSHLWLIFLFHLNSLSGGSGLVRPPRFKGKIKWGVFATRSPHRPNPIGLSLVRLEEVRFLDDKIELEVSGVDLVDGTPILDIKPYVPYADYASAKSSFTSPIVNHNVVWLCEDVIEKDFINQVISLDPRPSSSQNENTEFGLTVKGFNVTFRYLEGRFEIISAIRQE